MIEGQARRKLMLREDAYFGGIISGNGGAVPPGDEDGANGVHPAVSPGIGINAKLPQIGDVQTGFLFCLTDCRLFDAFAVVHESAGDRPTVGRIFPFDQNDAIINLNDNVHHRLGIIPYFYPSPAVRTDDGSFHTDILQFDK